jgi:hypothetical protein
VANRKTERGPRVFTRPALTRTALIRRGITLMEIMISMGIVLVGIVGIMAMMPLAARNLREGIESDVASTFGRGALHQITSRDVIDGDWIVVDVVNQRLDRLADNHAIRINSSFCFDPLYLGEHVAFVGENNLPGVLPTTGSLPYYPFQGEPAHSHPRMFRASLPLVPTVSGNLRPMVTALARQMCESQDDLAFSQPKDKTLPPLQSYNRLDDFPSDAWEAAPRLRQSQGRFSWMATIVPEIDAAGAVNDEFRRLSIVVFHDRVIDPSLVPTQFGPQIKHQELLFDVVFLSGGIAGGDVRLVTRPGRPGADLGEIRRGDWIMLGGTVTNATFQQQFRWYRVVDSSSNTLTTQDYNGDDVFTRDFTLVGPDWMRFEWLTYDMNSSPADNLNNANGPATRTQATWVRGVVSVLEKNVGVDPHDH